MLDIHVCSSLCNRQPAEHHCSSCNYADVQYRTADICTTNATLFRKLSSHILSLANDLNIFLTKTTFPSKLLCWDTNIRYVAHIAEVKIASSNWQGRVSKCGHVYNYRIINRQKIRINQLILTAPPRKASVFGPSSQAGTLYKQIPYCRIIDGVFEFGRRFKMGVHMETTKVMIISWQKTPRSKTAGECEVF